MQVQCHAFFLAHLRHDFKHSRMPDRVSLHLIDLAVFALYMIIAVGLGLWVARKGKDTAQS